MATPSVPTSFIHLSDSEFLQKLSQYSKPKDRSHNTHHSIHLPELSLRLNLKLPLPLPTSSLSEADSDPFTPTPDLENKSKIEVVYLGNSMLERLKNTGAATRLGNLGRGAAWNAGVGGDTNKNIVFRLVEGLYRILKEGRQLHSNAAADDDDMETSHPGHWSRDVDIRLWILASGTNDLHKKQGLRAGDVEAYRLLLEACLRIAPRSRVLACDMFYRRDIPNVIVDRANAMLEAVVGGVNAEVDVGGEWAGDVEGRRVVWVQARRLVGGERLLDHVHLDGEGYEIWDGVLWPWVCKMLGRDPADGETGAVRRGGG
ncbi:hypothetical protein K505DRAFT_328122 [Melanomma pulvis-pyrius CBS 109.77]|uniref:SGNH hydrolase-type esterase domain-containing protein n=1 Tax=Melanomma pulvis-pyrius CBS 109.77 TaxID=1314802 RepID=A0A6A6X0E4_9PLEO|nr:hypothetical protein K505DRAFT_328122 [Melanomma pulvis-pyrius CBS 109.77]